MELTTTEKEKYYNQIKKLIVEDNSYQTVKDYSKSKHDLMTKYEIGKQIIEAQGGEARAKYGNQLIKEFSKRLTSELGKSYSETLLKNARRYYLTKRICPTLSDKLSWSHIVELIWIKSHNEINYYTSVVIHQNLSVRQLRQRIKSKEYDRLPESAKKKLIENKEGLSLSETIKDPIVLYTNKDYETYNHKVLEEIIMEDLTNFLKWLGEGYMFVGKEYQIKLGNRYHYIDLLLYNIKYNSYVVLELKTGEVTSRDKGQIKEYMNYIDYHLKQINQRETYGIIACKKYEEWIINYFKDEKITVVKIEIKKKHL